MTRASRLTLAWLALVAATCASVVVAEHAGSRATIVGVALAIAVCKALVVLREYMAATALPRSAAWIAYAWTVACGAMIVALCERAF